MAGRVEVNVFNQSQGRFVKVFVDKRQQFETRQENQQSLGSFKKRDNVQPS